MWAATRATDVARQRHQVDEAHGIVLAVQVLVVADSPEGEDAALAALTLMMRLLKTVSFTPYVIYRVILGAILLIIAYT